ADDFLLAVIGPAEATGDHAAEVAGGFDERRFESLAGGADGRHHTAGRAAVDYDIEAARGRAEGARQGKEERQTTALSHIEAVMITRMTKAIVLGLTVLMFAMAADLPTKKFLNLAAIKT